MAKRILVVDDDEVVRKLLKILVSKMGYEVVEAGDGIQAIAQLKGHNFDLIICDVVMPKKDGWQVLREVKGNKDTEDIPVILLTAKNQFGDMFKGYELKADYYMTKPFTKGQLVYAIKLMLDQDTAEIRLS